MGAAVAGEVVKGGRDVIYLPEGRSDASRARATKAGLISVSSVEQLCSRADIIFSICPPAAAENVATSVGEAGFSGIYVDANAISPRRFDALATKLPDAQAVLDGAIFGPPPSATHQIVLYVAGPQEAAAQIAGCFTTGRVLLRHLQQEPPAASALKMAHSSFQKASRALAAVADAFAVRFDVTQELLAEADRNPRSPLTDPEYLPSVAARAWRWAPELRDVAAALRDAGLPAGQALAAAEVLDRWVDDKDSEPSLPEVLRQLMSSAPASATFGGSSPADIETRSTAASARSDP